MQPNTQSSSAMDVYSHSILTKLKVGFPYLDENKMGHENNSIADSVNTLVQLVKTKIGLYINASELRQFATATLH